MAGAGGPWHEFVVMLVIVCVAPSMSPHSLVMDSVATVAANNANEVVDDSVAPAAVITDAPGIQGSRWAVLKPIYTHAVSVVARQLSRSRRSSVQAVLQLSLRNASRG